MIEITSNSSSRARTFSNGRDMEPLLSSSSRDYSGAVEAEGRRISRRVSIAGEEDYWLLSAGPSRAKIRLSYAARPFYLRPIWQRTFNSMRLAHFVDYTRPLYPKLIVFTPSPLFLRRILGITLARELPPGNGRRSRSDHRSVLFPIFFLHFETQSRSPSRAIINIRGCLK